MDHGELNSEISRESNDFVPGTGPVPATESDVVTGDSVGEASPVVTSAAEPDGGSDLADLTLWQLTERVRASHAATRSACATALQYAMDAGDALIEGESRELPIPWKKWATDKNTCHVGLRTAYLYMQLAKARPRLEAALRDKPELSIRGAAKLIAKRKGTSQPQAQLGNSPITTNALPKPLEPTPPDPVATLAAILAGKGEDEAKDKVVTAAFAAKGLEWLLRVIPADWRIEMQTRAVNRLQARKNKIRSPHLKASEMVRRALSLVKIAATPEITPAVAASNETEAIAILRQLNVVLADFETDEIAIVQQHAKKKRCVKS